MKARLYVETTIFGAFHAEWELRFGPSNRFRVFYQIDRDSREVRIVAVGVKDRNHLFVGGEEVTL
jgi:hypothetical protein